LCHTLQKLWAYEIKHDGFRFICRRDGEPMRGTRWCRGGWLHARRPRLVFEVDAAGSEQSDVQSGKVERRKVDCDGGKLMLTAQQAGQSAGMIVRDLKPRPQSPVEPQLTIYGLSPIIELKGGGALLIERLDQPGERYEVALAAPHLMRGAFYDLARNGTVLTPGGTYRASAGTRQMIFKVDASAKPGATPIVSRLLRIQSGT
jgi:hypothetical protein